MRAGDARACQYLELPVERVAGCDQRPISRRMKAMPNQVSAGKMIIQANIAPVGWANQTSQPRPSQSVSAAERMDSNQGMSNGK